MKNSVYLLVNLRDMHLVKGYFDHDRAISDLHLHNMWNKSTNTRYCVISTTTDRIKKYIPRRPAIVNSDLPF